jgi:hypothetical protein
LQAEVALVFAQALSLLDDNNAVLFPFRDGSGGTGCDTGRLGAVIAGGGKPGDKYIREFAFFYG